MPSNLDSRFKQFAYGFSTPARVLALSIEHPKLILLSLLPVIMTLIVISISIYSLLAGVWHYSSEYFMNGLSAYASGLSHLLVLIVGAILLYFIFHTLNLFTSLIASPFNDIWAEATEEATGAVRIKLGFFNLLRVFALDLRKTVLSVFALLGFALLSFVPLLGLFSLLGFSLIQTFTFVTYPQSRRQHGIRESISWISKNWAVSLGFGIVTLLLFGVPVINLFALPLSVIGGTLIFLKK